MRAGLRVLGSVAAVGVVAWSAAARAEPDYLVRLATTARVRLDELAAARAPRLVPPVPVAVTWHATRLGSLELGAPLVALGGADLDGDGRGELYAVTAREVIGLALRGGKLAELGRVAFTGERAVPAPRDAVGTITVEGRELIAAASPWARELRVTLQGGVLAGRPGDAGFLVCPGERWRLAGGRNHFAGDAGPAYGARCRADLVDREGYPLRVRARLAATGRLAVEVQRCAPGAPGAPAGGCEPAGTFEHAGVGVAFELADVDRDGTPEVIASDATPPGSPDHVRVLALGGDDRRPLYKKPFQGGVVGIAAVDGDGDGAVEIIAAVRLVGATRVDLWRLN